MRERFQRFMNGRYGGDELSKTIMGLCLACLILNLILGRSGLYWLALVLLGISYFRMFSRDYARRYAENQKFLQMKEQVLSKLGLTRRQIEQRKTHHIYRCPSCKQKIRIPRGKGKICITCPKCRTEFTKKS